MAEKKKRIAKPIVLLGRIAFLTAIVMLAVYVFTVFADSDQYIDGFSEKNARLSFAETASAAEQLSRRPFDELSAVAEQLSNAKTSDEVGAIMSTYVGSPLFGDLRYYINGASYDARGLLIEGESNGKALIDELVATHKSGCTVLYYDGVIRQDCIAFFAPVYGSDYVDGVVSILPARGLLSLDSLMTGNLSAVMLVDRNGKKLAESHVKNFNYDFNQNNVYSVLKEIIHDKVTLQSLWTDLQNGEEIARTVKLPDGDYVVCSTPLSIFEGKLSLVSMTETDGIVAPELVYIRHVANISIIALISLLIGAVYAFFYYKQSKRDLAAVTYTDTAIGCPNAQMFKKTAGDLLARRDVSYAVALFELRQLRYIGETLSGGQTSDLLAMVAKVIETFCSPGETYGYLGEGKFAVLITLRDDNSVKDRVHLVGSVVAKNMTSSGEGNKRYFNIGVVNSVAGKRRPISELLMLAEVACERARNNMNLSYVTFDDNIGSEKIRNERIEAEMENALATGEFRIFLQPKYNVAGDRIDSAEVLVRWFDPKTGDYRFPGEFIGLFEANGFITKLDHFVYIESLKYLSEAAARGDKVVPIAVNVSMVTVNSPDFLDFYVENKKKYRIGDNFIIIEFTESFAMENYESARHMVDTLHKNGIRCSLDDFGSGYSSLVMLKNIPFDELKFDRSFLSQGYSEEGDNVIVGSMYALAKGLGIHVVQEGVENKELFDQVVASGCDIVQGYYYAKAIPTEEFRLFIKSNTSIKYKSLVK